VKFGGGQGAWLEANWGGFDTLGAFGVGGNSAGKNAGRGQLDFGLGAEPLGTETSDTSAMRGRRFAAMSRPKDEGFQSWAHARVQV